MRTRVIAFFQLALIFPAALFMTSLVVRNLGPPQYEPAHTAQQVVMWYAGRLWTLWVLLFALPCMVLVSGCVALRTRNRDTEQHSTRRSLAPPAVVSALCICHNSCVCGNTRYCGFPCAYALMTG